MELKVHGFRELLQKQSNFSIKNAFWEMQTKQPQINKIKQNNSFSGFLPFLRGGYGGTMIECLFCQTLLALYFSRGGKLGGKRRSLQSGGFLLLACRLVGLFCFFCLAYFVRLLVWCSWLACWFFDWLHQHA